jgi:phosphohistidine phosphatase
VKNLVIVRHAKSSWDTSTLNDIDRPLNGRGKHDAPLMRRILRERGLVPGRILSSPAKRARKTAKLIAAEVGYAADAIDIRDEIYMQGVPALMALVQTLDDAWPRVFLCGHNPDLTELVNRLSGESIANVPTCGIASIAFEVGSWAHVMAGSGRLVFFDYPKRHSGASVAD